MSEIPDGFIEVAVAARVLGITIAQMLKACAVLGIEPACVGDDMFLQREALDVLNGRLYPTDVAA